jgi:predicted nucleotidyltransferase
MENKVNALERYRQGVLDEFEANQEQILAQLQAIDIRITGVGLAGSVLSESEFREDSDIDLQIELAEGVDKEVMERVVYACRGQIGLGGGLTDVVGVIAQVLER